MKRIELITSKEYWVETLEALKQLGHSDYEIATVIANKMAEAMNYIPCCKSDSEQLPSKDDVYSEIKRLTEFYYNDDNVRKSAFGLGFSTGVNFVNKDILK